MLEIRHFSKTYSGGKRAVDDLNLTVEAGSIYGFIGHNGAGKTTTLKSVVGIQQFDSGRITIGGHSIQDDPIACKKMLAYIPDNPDLYEFMTGIQYLNFIADIFGVEESARQERIRKYAGLFELTGDLAQPVAAYSHGMKQKLAIISAWLHEPKLILMDEPFVGLDPKASHILKGMMREVCDAGGAIFFSTHVLEVAEKLCDKVAIMYAGEIVEYGTLQHIFLKTSHPYTKGLFGSIPSLTKDVDRLEPIKGATPNPADLPKGCKFHLRCPNAMEKCSCIAPETVELEPGHLVQCHLYSREDVET